MRSFLDNQTSAVKNLDPSRTAVIAIHWQVDVVKSAGALRLFDDAASGLGIVDRAARLIGAARAAGVQIIFSNTVYRHDGLDLVRNNPVFNSVFLLGAARRGQPGTVLIPEFTVHDQDLFVDHVRLSAFYGTPLDAILRGRRIDTLIVFGIATNVAVDTTVRDAIQMGYNVTLVEDCCCSSAPEYHEAALLTLRVLSTEVTDAATLMAKFQENR
jgi:nicotinamidase-related amidase